MNMQINTLIMLLVFSKGFIVTEFANAEQLQTPHDAEGIEYKYGLISINMTGISMEKILRNIGKIANIQIVLHGDFSEKVNLSVTSTSIENVIRLLVHNRNFVIVYASDNEKKYKSIEKIYLYNRTLESKFQIEPASPKDIEDLDLLAQLTTLPNEEAIPAFAKKLTEKKSQVVTQFVIESLIDIGGDQAASALAEGLVDDRGLIRTDIVKALGRLDSKQASQILAQIMYSDPDPDIRIAAVKQLANFKTEPAKAYLEDAASQDKNEQLRLEARHVLKTWKYEETPPNK